MKNLLLPAFIVFILSTGAIVKTQFDKPAANVEQVDGLYIFSHAKPSAEFEVIGASKVKGMVMSERADALLKPLLKKVKKDYPTADGVIVSEDYITCDVIKFK